MSLSVQFLFNIQKQPHIQPPLCKGRCRTNVRRRDCEVDFIKSLSHFFISKNDSSLYKGAFDGQEQAPALRSHKFSISTNFSVWQQPLIAVYTNNLQKRRTELFAIGKCLPVRCFVAYHAVADKISTCRFAIVLPSFHPLAASPAV